LGLRNVWFICECSFQPYPHFFSRIQFRRIRRKKYKFNIVRNFQFLEQYTWCDAFSIRLCVVCKFNAIFVAKILKKWKETY
jgi:hypothetical protein